MSPFSAYKWERKYWNCQCIEPPIHEFLNICFPLVVSQKMFFMMNLFTWAKVNFFSLKYVKTINQQWHIGVTAKCEFPYDQFYFTRAEIYINVKNRNKNEIKLAIPTNITYLSRPIKEGKLWNRDVRHRSLVFKIWSIGDAA